MPDGAEITMSQKICPLCRWFCGEGWDCQAGAELRFLHMSEDYDREIVYQWQQAFPPSYRGPEFYTHCADCGKAYTLSQHVEPFFCGCIAKEGREL
jgi:hypothetical protein